jgi:hypothetical protein
MPGLAHELTAPNLETGVVGRLASSVAPLAPAALVAGLAVAGGGYFPTSWNWAALLAGWVVAIALVVRRSATIGRLELAQVVGLACLAGWTWLSLAWSATPTQTVLEGQRALVLPLAVAATLVFVRRDRVTLLTGGLLAAIAIVSLYSLGTRLIPDRLGQFDPVAGSRLSAPMGYWNALGIFGAFGVLLALGFAARGRAAVPRAAAAASLLVLVPMIYFTFSRGAWAALGVGLVVAISLDPRRLQLLATALVLAPAPAAAVYVASGLGSLTGLQAHIGAAAHDGHRLAALLVGLALLNAVLALALRSAEARVVLSSRARSRLQGLLVVTVLAGLAFGLFAGGGPARLWNRSVDAFNAPPPSIDGSLNQRLFNFSGSRRSDFWKVAADDVAAHPVLGSGAGSYELYWVAQRPIGKKARDAHSLYLETLAELGPVGLLLVLAALAIPVVGVFRARMHPLVPVLAGVYGAYLAHTGIDWDWEELAVTLTALVCGTAILVAGRREPSLGLPRIVRLGGAAFAIASMVVAFVGLVGNAELARSGTAARAGNWTSAAAHARRAHTWAPWSSEPWQALGEAQLALGELKQARSSLRHAIAKSSNDWTIWFDLARSSDGAAQHTALARAVSLNPLSPEIKELDQELVAEGQPTVLNK